MFKEQHCSGDVCSERSSQPEALRGTQIIPDHSENERFGGKAEDTGFTIVRD